VNYCNFVLVSVLEKKGQRKTKTQFEDEKGTESPLIEGGGWGWAGSSRAGGKGAIGLVPLSLSKLKPHYSSLLGAVYFMCRFQGKKRNQHRLCGFLSTMWEARLWMPLEVKPL
jgi:hypothetical protein